MHDFVMHIDMLMQSSKGEALFHSPVCKDLTVKVLLHKIRLDSL